MRDVGNVIFEKWCFDFSINEVKVLRIFVENENFVVLEKLVIIFEMENLMIFLNYLVEEVLKSFL